MKNKNKIILGVSSGLFVSLVSIFIIVIFFPNQQILSQSESNDPEPVFSREPAKHFFPFEPATKIKVQIIPTVEVNHSTDGFVYTYKIISDTNSIQNVHVFAVPYNLYEPQTVDNPKGWEHYMPWEEKPFIVWSATDYEDSELPSDYIDDGNIPPSPYDIQPGKSTDGFRFELKALPGIGNFYAQGFTKIPSLDETILQQERDELNEKRSLFIDSISGKTVTPQITLTNITPTQIVDHLIAQKHAAFKLGWITNQGIVNSLDKKLDQVKNHLSKGQAKTAKNVLNAFTQELQAQRGKQVTENAYSLLHPTAMYLLNKLN